jgi:hypothetical protein
MNTDELTAELQAHGLDRIAATQVVQQVVELVGSRSGFDAVQKNLTGPNSVALKDEDLDLLKVCAEMCSSFVAAASVGAFAPAAIAALVVLLYRVRTRGVDITPLQAAVLKAVRSPRALTPTQIAQELGIDGVDEQAVCKELFLLADAPRRDGVRIKLAVADVGGRWTAQGV